MGTGRNQVTPVGPGNKNVIDLTDTAEADRVLKTRQELGHTILFSPSTTTQAAELPQPQMVGGEHEPAPQQLVSAGQQK